MNLVPYVGSLATAAAVGLVGFLQFGTLNMALVVAGASLAIHTVIGNLLTPWLTSRASRLSPVAVFVGLLAWGWLWGVWGLLLGVPILMIVKSTCDRIDDLKPIGEFLGS
jgi:predicted PurR-regulated permease PerM